MKYATSACVLLSMTALSAGLRADEEKIPLQDVPRAVLDAVKTRFPNGEIKSAEKEVEDGQTSYEIALRDGGHAIDVALSANGAIVEIEKEIAVKDVPKPVASAVAAKYPGATIRKAEEIVAYKGGKEEKSYEVVVAESGKKSVEVKLSADGKIVKHEEDDEDEGDD